MIYALDGICKSRKYSLTVNLSKSLSKWCRKQNTTRAEWEREKKEHGNNNKQQNQSLNVGGCVSDDCKAERHLIKMKSCADRIRTWIIICRQSEVYVSIVRGTANCGLHPLHRGMLGRDVEWVVARSCAMNSNNKRYDFFFLDSILESVCCAFLSLWHSLCLSSVVCCCIMRIKSVSAPWIWLVAPQFLETSNPLGVSILRKQKLQRAFVESDRHQLSKLEIIINWIEMIYVASATFHCSLSAISLSSVETPRVTKLWRCQHTSEPDNTFCAKPKDRAQCTIYK